ncbi:MAG TPA: GDP-mannose 4,6-dehydratase [Solirubrobacteraceae bacterium]|nr:GDP-mannose 4,6-dehydratase [Solirubrobacteraceae bacterium]
MSAAPTALITGIAGQDGSFLAELLLEKGYAVAGMVHAGGDGSLGCSEHLRGEIEVLEGELLEPATLRAAIVQAAPSEVYHLAGPSFVPASWERPRETFVAIVGSCAAILETVRELAPATRVFVAASGAIFGDAEESPQREDTPCHPTNPYAVAKLAAHQLVGAMRRRDGLHASSGVVFNHESERRPERFVTRRITRGAAAISLGLAAELSLGSLDAVRDWSFAGDVVRGAWLMLQREQPSDYVLASGVARTVADFARTAFECVELDWERYVSVDPTRVRAPERTSSVGDPSRARDELGWEPAVTFDALVARMVNSDLRSLGATPYTGAR